MGILENRPHGHGELLAAGPALVEATACPSIGIWAHLVGLGGTGLRANRTVRPAKPFKHRPGLALRHNWAEGRLFCHLPVSSDLRVGYWLGSVKYIIPQHLVGWVPDQLVL